MQYGHRCCLVGLERKMQCMDMADVVILRYRPYNAYNRTNSEPPSSLRVCLISSHLISAGPSFLYSIRIPTHATSWASSTASLHFTTRPRPRAQCDRAITQRPTPQRCPPLSLFRRQSHTSTLLYHPRFLFSPRTLLKLPAPPIIFAKPAKPCSAPLTQLLLIRPLFHRTRRPQQPIKSRFRHGWLPRPV